MINNQKISLRKTDSTINQEKTSTSLCPTKTILLGEHSVLYGSYAVAIPNHKFYVKITATPIFLKNNHSNKVVVTSDLKNIHIISLVNKAFNLLGIKKFPLKLTINSHCLIGAGLGSSAALCTSILNVISKLKNRPLTKDKLHYLGKKLEHNIHGTSSGLDTAVISHNIPILYQQYKGVIKPFSIRAITIKNIASHWPFILIDSGERSQTRDMIIKAKHFFMSSQGKKSIHDINKMSLNLTKTLIIGNYLKAAEIMQFGQHILSLSGVSTKSIDNIIHESIKLGALSAKITGAGGGGSVLALLDPKYYKQQFGLFQKKFGKESICTLF
jgi:mevalonate kinase